MTLHTFNTSTLASPATYSLSFVDTGAPMGLGGSNIVKGMKIFKVGTFTDSLGRVNTWTQEHLAQMVQFFHSLRGNQVLDPESGTMIWDGVIPHVPIRVDHTVSLRDVVGYFSNVYLDPAKPGFLLADIEFTEPDAFAKYNRGTYRNRSVEVGRYEDNAGNAYEPVVLGLAFVDLPAVEGLFRKESAQATGDQSPPASAHNQGEPMTFNPGATPSTPAAAAPAAAAPAAAAPAADPTAANGTGQPAPAAAVPVAAPAVTPAATPAPADHARPVVHTFQVNGQPTQDFGVVQAHIVALETFRKEAIDSHRNDFVDQLAKDNKIVNTAAAGFKTMALSMTAEQFELFKQGYQAAPAMPMLGSIPTGQLDASGNPVVPTPGADPKVTQIETLKDVIASHRRSGESEDKIKEHKSYKQLLALGVTDI